MHRSNCNLTFVSLTALCSALVGCGADAGYIEGGEELSVTEEPLNGTVIHLGGCNQTQLTKAALGFQIAVRNLRDTKMSDCMAEAVLSGTSRYAEEALAQMREDRWTGVMCADLTNALAQAQLNTDGEIITFDRAFLNNAANDTNVVAAVALHEVSHNKGYSHANSPANDHPNLAVVNSWEWWHTVPSQFANCSFSISSGTNIASPFSIRRSSLRMETTLSPVGRTGGSAFSRHCHSVGLGLQVRSGSLIDAIGLTCLGVLGGGTTGLAGGGGGGLSTDACAGDEVLVGVQGTAGSTLIGIRAMCGKINDVLAGTRSAERIRLLELRGGTGGHPFRRWCPAGMAVLGIKGKAGDLVDRLEVDCGSIGTGFSSVVETELPQVGGNGGSLQLEKCAGRSALVGLTHQTGSSVDRLGGLCLQLDTTCNGSTCTDFLLGGSAHLITAHGGSGGRVGEQFCAGGTALVGLDLRAGSTIDQVRGVCANVIGWSNGSNTALSLTTSSTLPAGGNGGTFQQRRCNVGSFMTGWWIRSGDMVDALRPICRNFP